MDQSRMAQSASARPSLAGIVRTMSRVYVTALGWRRPRDRQRARWATDRPERVSSATYPFF